MPAPRAGFTLFEVAVALALTAVVAAAAALLLPTALRAQAASRFELYAAAKAVELVDTFASAHDLEFAFDAEAYAPWDVPSGYSALAWDLEHRVATYRNGMYPLPTRIARRLDSDGDEIQRVLDDGGYLYYSQPLATTGFKEDAVPEAPANEAQRLVFAVVGCAQQDAIQIFPWKAWPYYAPWPSPPIHGRHAALTPASREIGFSVLPDTPWIDGVPLWEHAVDDAAEAVARLVEGGVEYGYGPYQAAPSADRALRYCQAALWYCARRLVPRAMYDAETPLADFAPAPEPWEQVQALRFLAHAAACLTRWHDGATLRGAGVAIPPLTHDGVASEAVVMTEAKIVALHDSALRLAMLFAARRPYDWSVPRPVNRMIMMDHPLLQWDLFSPRLTGRVSGAAVLAEQWRAVAAAEVACAGAPGPGPSYQYPAKPIGDIWGDPRRFSLTARFAAGERARQLVFWAVDWRRWEDAETAPSAPVDASRYPIGAPRAGDGPASFPGRMTRIGFRDWRQFSFRNPERVLSFLRDVSAEPDGAPVEMLRLGSQYNGRVPPPGYPRGDEDFGPSPEARARFCGVHGGDRDFDGRLGRGPLPTTVRLRATLVGRFVFYDPRVAAPVR